MRSARVWQVPLTTDGQIRCGHHPQLQMLATSQQTISGLVKRYAFHFRGRFQGRDLLPFVQEGLPVSKLAFTLSRADQYLLQYPKLNIHRVTS